MDLANSAAQIVQFPKDRIVRSRIPAELAQQKLHQQINYMDMVADEHIKQLFISLKMNGINIDSSKEASMLFGVTVEALRACLYAIHGHKHILNDQFQPIIDIIRSRNTTDMETLYTLAENEIEMNEDDEDDDDS